MVHQASDGGGRTIVGNGRFMMSHLQIVSFAHSSPGLRAANQRGTA